MFACQILQLLEIFVVAGRIRLVVALYFKYAPAIESSFCEEKYRVIGKSFYESFVAKISTHFISFDEAQN